MIWVTWALHTKVTLYISFYVQMKQFEANLMVSSRKVNSTALRIDSTVLWMAIHSEVCVLLLLLLFNKKA